MRDFKVIFHYLIDSNIKILYTRQTDISAVQLENKLVISKSRYDIGLLNSIISNPDGHLRGKREGMSPCPHEVYT